MKSSPNKRWKGHCLMCANDRGKLKGLGRRWKDPHAVNKAFGKARRRSRKFMAEDEF